MENNKKLIIVIPSYEPPKEFVEYAKQVASKADHLVVVNDGSNETYSSIFEEIDKIENTVVISYDKNQGKGHALKTAFDYCSKTFNKDDIVITADCDGQHKIEDVFKVYKVAKEHPNDLILGSRDFN